MISLVPSIYHYLGEVGFIFLHSVGRATVTRTGISHSADAVGRSKFGTDRRLIRRFGAAFALIQLSATAVFHLLINILFLVVGDDIILGNDSVDIVTWHTIHFELVIQLD